MATIYERKYSNGRTVYRATLRRRHFPTFCLTFDDWKEACDWVEKNELLYYEDPEKYFKWRDETNKVMRRERLMSYQHIIRSKQIKP